MQITTRFFAAVGMAAFAVCSMAQFTSGNLVVSVIGDGLATLSNAATQVQLQEYTVGGTAMFNVMMPTSVSGSNLRLAASGNATSEGFLFRSVDTNYLTIQGYDANLGTAAIATTTSATVSRVIGRVDAFGVVDTSTGMNTFSAGNIRSSVSVDGSHYWASGSNTGPQSVDHGGANLTTISTSVTNLRVSNIFSSQLYVSSASGAFVGVNAVGVGLPTTSGNTTTNVIATGTGSSPYDFYFADANTCYIADDRSLANGGGLQKWTLSGTWSLAYTLNTGLTAGLRGLCATTDPGSGVTTLYATSADTVGAVSGSKLVTVTDTGAASAFSTIVTAAANVAFRGVEFCPNVPEPGTWAALAAGAILLIARRRR
jgi:hypothetical protein